MLNRACAVAFFFALCCFLVVASAPASVRLDGSEIGNLHNKHGYAGREHSEGSGLSVLASRRAFLQFSPPLIGPVPVPD
jgi:hypothetical protein